MFGHEKRRPDRRLCNIATKSVGKYIDIDRGNCYNEVVANEKRLLTIFLYVAFLFLI